MPFSTRSVLALGFFSLIPFSSGYAGEGITLAGCQQNVRAVVLRAVRDDAGPDEPGKLYVAQSKVEGVCGRRAVESGLMTASQVEKLSSDLSDVRDKLCARKDRYGAIPTTGDQNECELELLSMMLRMYAR